MKQNETLAPDHSVVFEAFGVRVRIDGDRPESVDLGMEVAMDALIGRPVIIENKTDSVDHSFTVYRAPNGRYGFLNGSIDSNPMEREVDFRRLLNTMIRVHVAEKARGVVFVHAGVVGWRGRAIMLPARSRSGKTTLVGELIRLGAEYFSDEYAVIDPKGMVHPYPRDLAVRPKDSEIPIRVHPSEFGAKPAKDPIPLGMVLLTSFEEGADFRPEVLSMGLGIMETIPEVIPIRFNTDFSLKVLNTAFRRAIIARSSRGEAVDAARSILYFFDESHKLANTD